MLQTAAVSLLAVVARQCLTLAGWGVPVAVLHLAFAVGILPLILAAISHFVPVLTRTGDPSPDIARLPRFAQVAGLLAVAALQGSLPRSVLHLAATLDLLCVLTLLRWVLSRAGACLGQPHPGWRWYGLALSCSLMALLAVPLMLALPEFYLLWRKLHLHLNTLGLVGFAALGTLPVLLPTALGRPDPAAVGWLRQKLWPLLVAVLLVVFGAAWYWPLSLLGALLGLLVVGSLLRQWRQTFGWAVLLADGVSASLLTAGAGLGLTLLAGLAHAAGYFSGRQILALWVAVFLLPLVTGALSQLLPVWCWPGPQTPQRLQMRCQLAAPGRWRAVFFLLAGGALCLDWMVIAMPLVLLAMLLFVIPLLLAMREWSSTR